jgi:DNA-directed RNA polymerase subunit K/omega
MRPPDGMGAYRFSVLASLRAAQLISGCTARLDGGTHKPITVAQLEVVAGLTAERLEDAESDADTAMESERPASDDLVPA